MHICQIMVVSWIIWCCEWFAMSCDLWQVVICDELWCVTSCDVWRVVMCDELWCVTSCDVWWVVMCDELWQVKSSIPCLVSTYPLALKILASISPFVRRVASRLKLEGVLKGNSVAWMAQIKMQMLFPWMHMFVKITLLSFLIVLHSHLVHSLIHQSPGE